MQNRVSPELRRNPDDKMFFGVASGLADYFGIDVGLVRVGFVVTALLSAGTTLLVYLSLAILVPEQERTGGVAVEPGSKSRGSYVRHRYRTSTDSALLEHRRSVAGWSVIVLGVILLAANVGLFSWLSFGRFWPVLIIALGVALILGLFRTERSGD